MDYSPWDCKGSDTTGWLTLSISHNGMLSSHNKELNKAIFINIDTTICNLRLLLAVTHSQTVFVFDDFQSLENY